MRSSRIAGGAPGALECETPRRRPLVDAFGRWRVAGATERTGTEPPLKTASATSPVVRTSLLAYSAVLTALGSGVALGLVHGAAATAVSASRTSALAASVTPTSAMPHDVAPTTTAPPPPAPRLPPPTAPPTTPPTTRPVTVRTVPSHPVIPAAAASFPPSVNAIFACIRQKESGGNYAENTGNSYYGAYQFDLGTWHSLGYPGRPDQAPPGVQDAAAQKLYSERGFAPWPNTSRACGA